MVEAKGCPNWRIQGQELITRGIAMKIGVITIGIKITMGLTITICSHCFGTMGPGHAGCLLPTKNVTDRHEGHIRCSSLTLEREGVVCMSVHMFHPSNHCTTGSTRLQFLFV
jgi:hypothetical protein